MPSKVCTQCGKSFEAASPRARLCSAKCRKASSRGTPPDVAAQVVQVGAQASGSVSAVVQVRRELEDAGRLNTYLGAAAVKLAERIDESTAVMGFAALVKQLQSTMTAAMDGVVKAADPVDEVKARRDAKLAAS